MAQFVGCEDLRVEARLASQVCEAKPVSRGTPRAKSARLHLQGESPVSYTHLRAHETSAHL
eukprot:4673757-Alexandrium_andersonii.AAC.1